ncbi:hypothetical protein AOQ84DRAFT_383528 [Glonium stellatum]|uniref:Nucleotide-diphospho-sugar transferase domain-containing protein n=1 Tax=Glonium stellatum TaxID=574774 RepID=A0A8E2ENT0_9PEZI|nr:hypothetical protein AOQ84DRAFT_383528 [Glonium stellatum]
MHTNESQSPSLKESIQSLYSSIRLPILAPSYTDPNGTLFELPEDPLWTTAFGKDLVIVDIDTRVPTGFNQIFNEKKMDWEKFGDDTVMDTNIELTSEAVINHFLYAQIHGYDYRFYQAAKIPGHHDSWVKVHAVAKLLKSYRFVVFLDADAVVHHLEVPLEWLFNRWQITENTSIALPVDVDREECLTCDTKGKVMLNTGLIVAQQLNRTFEMFDAWTHCTDEKRYPGCGQWKEDWAHEQRAFAEYIRYDFNRSDDVREISCFDANGYPEKPDYVLTNCNGDFVRHHWVYKHASKTAIGNSIVQSVAEILQREILQQKNNTVLNETKTHRKNKLELN